MNKQAVISQCGKYRYFLLRRWGDGPTMLFLMLNPSTADASIDDATIRKCIGFAQRFGFGGIAVVNLFAYRATKPKDMLAAADPIGPENDDYILSNALTAGMVVCAWGPNASRTDRPQKVIEMLRFAGVELKCLHITQDGSPGHPLMLSYDRPLLDFVCRASAQGPQKAEVSK